MIDSRKVTIEISGDQIAEILKDDLECLYVSNFCKGGYHHPDDADNARKTGLAFAELLEYYTNERPDLVALEDECKEKLCWWQQQQTLYDAQRNPAAKSRTKKAKKKR